ncbi:MAG TPA: transglycosylase SLT domain-containing protein [Polyangiaceae bacterium]|jgi:membrane-bound lytic murein transglycosylase D
MRYARTAALLTSVFSAGITLGYGAVPAQLTRALTSRVGLTAPMQESGASAPAGAGNAPAAAQPASAATHESSELAVLRSPEFEMFGERTGERAPAVPRPQTSQPSSVCGTGPERRLCNASDVDPGAAPAPEGNWMVGLRAPDLPVHASVRVERFFRYLTESTNGRKLFRAWLKRSGRYHDVVARALHDRGMPQDLEALVFVESGYSPTAVSSEGAMGLWQFMPGTAHVYGLAVDEDFDERRSIEKATDAATRYLSDLYERFGSWELAMAAYDMGYGRLTQRVQELSTNDYWTLSLVRGAIPDEALAYVPKIIAVALLLRNLDRFGFDEVQQDPPLTSSELDVPGGTPLRIVARAAGTSVDRLHLLNPELLTAYVPDRGTTIPLHVPSRGVARANTMLPRLLAHFHPGQGGGDDDVGDRFDWGAEEILPTPTRRAPRTSSLWNDPMMAQPAARPSLEMQEAADRDQPDDGASAEAETAVVFYRVDEGETLPGIARRFGIKTARVVADNRLDPAAKLQKGMLLKLHVPRAALSRLASERPLDDSQYAPPVQLDGGTSPDDDTTIAAPAPTGGTPELRTPRDDIDPFAPAHPGPRNKRPHSGRSSGRRSMADFPELFARKP